MHLEFEKWHGNSNDFIVVSAPHVQRDYLTKSLQKVAVNLCNKSGSGIAADGILVLYSHPQQEDLFATYTLDIINSDGSLAATCGNGLRCAAGFVKRKSTQITDLQTIEFVLKNNQKALCRFINDKGEQPIIEISMGNALIDADVSWFEEYKNLVTAAVNKSGKADLVTRIQGCHLANPHLILFMKHLDYDFLKVIGPALQVQGSLDGINVHFAESYQPSDAEMATIKKQIGRPLEDSFAAISWERGAGATQACGSGATAIVAAAFHAQELLSDKNWVGVKMPGGFLYIKESDSGFQLAGPAKYVFRGSLEI